MNERAKVFLGAMGALFLLVILLTPPASRQPPASKPVSTDDGRFGLLGLKRWLEHGGVDTVSLRRRYTDLDTVVEAAEGNLLITSLPHALPARTRELDALLEWTESGNSVLLLTAEADFPRWQWQGVMRFGESDQGQVLQHFGFEFEYPRKDDKADAGEKTDGENQDDGDPLEALTELQLRPERHDMTLRPRADYPRLNGVEQVATYSALSEPADIALTGLEANNLALPLLEHGDNGRAVFWEAAAGRGRLWVSAYPELFGNVALGEADNARLLAGLLGAALGPRGRVVFDDFHFGLSDLYDPAAFFDDRRLHITLAFILAFWLAYVVGRSPRLAPPRPARSVPRESDFVEALAGLCARRQTRPAVASGLAAHFFNELRRRHRRPENGRPAWDLLEQHAGVAPDDCREFREQVARAERGRPVELTRFTHLLNNIRNAL